MSGYMVSFSRQFGSPVTSCQNLVRLLTDFVYKRSSLCYQLQKLEHVMLAGFTHEPVVELSERLSALTGGRLGH
jgi:hypothetical protein